MFVVADEEQSVVVITQLPLSRGPVVGAARVGCGTWRATDNGAEGSTTFLESPEGDPMNDDYLLRTLAAPM